MSSPDRITRPKVQGNPRWPEPTSLADALARADQTWEAIERIDVQLEDPTRQRHMTGEEYARWRFRANHAREIRLSELRALRRYIFAQGGRYFGHRYRMIMQAAQEVVELSKEGGQTSSLEYAITKLEQALKIPEVIQHVEPIPDEPGGNR